MGVCVCACEFITIVRFFLQFSPVHWYGDYCDERLPSVESKRLKLFLQFNSLLSHGYSCVVCTSISFTAILFTVCLVSLQWVLLGGLAVFVLFQRE